MNEREKIEAWVIAPYRRQRSFDTAQANFWEARDHFYRLVEREKPESILDVGCGQGFDARPLTRMVPRYVGIDPIRANLKQARLHNPGGDFRVGFMQETGLEDESFEWVWTSTVWDILPSVDDMRAGIEECLRVAQRRVFSLDATANPRFMSERYMMIPMQYGLRIERVNYNASKRKSNYLWTIDKNGI